MSSSIPANPTTQSTVKASSRLRFWRRQPIGLYLILIVLAIIVGFPFYWMLLLSFTPESEIYRWPIRFLPYTPTLENYRAIFTRPDLQIPRWFLNQRVHCDNGDVACFVRL